MAKYFGDTEGKVKHCRMYREGERDCQKRGDKCRPGLGSMERAEMMESLDGVGLEHLVKESKSGSPVVGMLVVR